MTKKSLRYFQQDAINAVIQSLKEGETPYINAVTGFGKSVVLADLTERALQKGKRVLQLVPNHTLCIQNYEQTFSYVTNKSAVGICSAKVGKFQISKQCVIATQTSFVKRRTKSGAFDVILIDECDMVSPEPGTTYQKIITSLLRLNPSCRIVGMTGSPVREKQGFLEDKVKNGNAIFTKCCYSSDIPRLIKEGYLSSVEILNTHEKVDLTGVKIVRGEYDQAACGVKFDAIIDGAVADFKQLFAENNIETALIFASNIANGKRIVDAYGNHNECKLAHGEMSNHERNELIRWLRNGTGKRCLVNCGLYTRGFDFPALQALVFLRATTSLRLYLQMIGRLLRTHEEKAFGFLADYGQNVERFGSIDALKPPKQPRSGEIPKKMCVSLIEQDMVFEGLSYREGDVCGYPNNLSAKKCKCCEAVFISENEDGNYSMKSKGQILAEKREKEEAKQFYEVSSVAYSMYKKGDKEMIKIDFYSMNLLGMEDYVCSEYLFSVPGRAIAIVKSMLKDPKDLKKIYQFQDQMCAKNVLFLLENYREQFFKDIKGITVINNKGFKNIVEFHF